MTAHFCIKSGARIVAPGVSKSVDPINGVDECDPPPVAPKGAPIECAQCVELADICKTLNDKLCAAQGANAELTKTIEELTKPAAPPIDPPKAEKADKPATSGKGK